MKKRLLGLIIALISTQQLFSGSIGKIGNYNFSLRDIENECEVYKYSESYGELDCSGNKFNPLAKCEVYFSDKENGEFECSDSDFRIIENQCSVHMYSDDYGEIEC
ncbi:hypothetical protein ACLHDG_00195 [Sulfurovum sp. CS9]|uniref:hypothetical protein n=1 Tax=Sulfurovum sp. CS9 TaxID=3391146 RepID=UPI0039ED5B2A